jgi:hypothetical protein
MMMIDRVLNLLFVYSLEISTIGEFKICGRITVGCAVW